MFIVTRLPIPPLCVYLSCDPKTNGSREHTYARGQGSLECGVFETTSEVTFQISVWSMRRHGKWWTQHYVLVRRTSGYVRAREARTCFLFSSPAPLGWHPRISRCYFGINVHPVHPRSVSHSELTSLFPASLGGSGRPQPSRPGSLS